MATMAGHQSPGPEAHWQAALQVGRFLLQRCPACARHVFSPRTLCPHCGGADLEWVEASGSGTVYSTTTVRRKPDQGGDYDVSLIDLAEGVRMMSCVVGIAPDAVAIGMRVKAELDEKEGRKRIVFRPAGERA